MLSLPIDQIREDLAQTLSQNARLILIATPGSGKSTRAPLFIYEDQKPEGLIIVLQPRRAAAMMLAKRVSSETNTPLKELIGYQVKGDQQTQASTKIIYMTPGIFLRRSLSEGFLDQVSYIILDEVHERSLEIDLCLALSLRWQEQRPHLKCIAMSATIQASDLEHVFTAPTLVCEHKPHELEVVHQSQSIPDAIRDFNKRFQDPSANVLIFEAGRKEIEDTLRELQSQNFDQDYELCSLYGEMPLQEQQRILSPSERRRIIVATNIAETSLTLPGVRCVIDSGQCKLLRRDIASGANQLKKEWISKDRADQRAGRAARTNTGITYRLWSRQQQNGLRISTDPEILRCDISSLILWLAAFELPLEQAKLLTLPSGGALQKQQKELTHLGMLNHNQQLTQLGEKVLHLPLHPKYAKALLEVAPDHFEDMSKMLVFLEGQIKFPFAQDFRSSGDLQTLTEVLRRSSQKNFQREIQRLQKAIQSESELGQASSFENWHHHLIQCLPENLCFALPQKAKQYRIMGGGTGKLETDEEKNLPQILWAAKIHFKSKSINQATLQWVLPLKEKELLHIFSNALNTKLEFEWDAKNFTMIRHQIKFFKDDIHLSRVSKPIPFQSENTEEVSNMILLKKILLPDWEEKVEPWLRRYRQFKQHFPDMDLLDFNDEDLSILVQEAVSGVRSWKDLLSLNWISTFQSALSWEDLHCFETHFPETFQLHPKRKVKIQYFDDLPPMISSKLQDYYNLKEHPSIANQQIQLRCELLAPNQRPVQTTQDIIGFWDSSYPLVKKDLYRRYPKHEWR